MKSPQALATKLAQQWNSADWRERQLLGGGTAWPLTLSIGQPDPAVFLSDAAALRNHLQQWRAVEDLGLGSVQWRAAQPGQQRCDCCAHPLATGQALAVHRRHPPL